jgi:hypothetical protein
MFRLPFDELRANGTGIEIVALYPFVVSLSNHSNDFFSNLLVPRVSPSEPYHQLSAKRLTIHVPDTARLVKHFLRFQ